MRRVDRWLGVPICALLTILRKSIGDRPVPRPPAFIVFFKLAEQGSTVLAWPAISNAIARVGRDRVYFVVFEENRAILDAVEWIPSENVLAVRSDNIWSVTVGVLRTLRRLRRIGVDAAIDLEFFARSSAILAYLSGASRRAGFHAYGGGAGYRGDLCTHRVSFNGHLHTSQAFETLVDALDREPADFPAYGMRAPEAEALPEFHPSAADEASVRQLLEGVDCAAAPRILLNANASDLLPLRRWPARAADVRLTGSEKSSRMVIRIELGGWANCESGSSGPMGHYALRFCGRPSRLQRRVPTAPLGCRS
jgi:hypothetical protein